MGLTDPFHVFPERLAVAGSKDLKLHVWIRSFGAEVHQPCQAADSSLQQSKKPDTDKAWDAAAQADMDYWTEDVQFRA